MVVQGAIDNLKEKPHEEKKAVASGIAIFVVIILLIGWGFMFVRKLQRSTAPTLQTGTVPLDQFDAEFLQQTQQQINQLYQNSAAELRDVRDQSADTGASTGIETEGVSPSDNVEGFGAEESQF